MQDLIFIPVNSKLVLQKTLGFIERKLLGLYRLLVSMIVVNHYG